MPTPAGDLTLPLDNGLKTQATWFTVDASIDLSDDWHLQNTAQAMQNDQEHNAIVPGNALPAADFVRLQSDSAAASRRGAPFSIFFTNLLRRRRQASCRSTPPNGLVAPSIEWHVAKPISAIQDQLQLRKTFGRHTPGDGCVLRQLHPGQPLELHGHPDGRAGQSALPGSGGDACRRARRISVTKNGFRHFLSTYANGSGQTSIVSGVLGGEIQLTDRLRADLGGRVEYDSYVQSSERTATFDLDNNPATTYDNEQFGNGSFRHFTREHHRLGRAPSDSTSG